MTTTKKKKKTFCNSLLFITKMSVSQRENLNKQLKRQVSNMGWGLNEEKRVMLASADSTYIST